MLRTHVNRLIARLLANLLRHSGALVQITDRGLENKGYFEKAYDSNRFESHWFIEIAGGLDEQLAAGNLKRFSPLHPRCFHYPGSKGGIRYSRRFLEQYFGVGVTVDKHHHDSSNYAVINTSCPAILVYPGFPPAGSRSKTRLNDWIRNTALNLYHALRRSVNSKSSALEERRLRYYCRRLLTCSP